MHSRTISGYERGEYEPESIERVALALGFPVQFFFGDDPDELDTESVSFRAQTKMTAAQRHSALTTGAIGLMLNEWLDNNFHLPEPELPDLSDEAPEVAAAALREMWGLGERPIKNMVHLLESKGVRVFSLALDTLRVDAFSAWRDGVPYVFLNTMKSSERSRFDAGHELGHLVLHPAGGARGTKIEREADAFSSSFLMPADDVKTQIPRAYSLNQLIEKKKRWKVSLAALTRRLHDVGRLTDWRYRTFCIEIAKRGFRKNEPAECEREASQVLAKVFTALKEEGLTKGDIARELAIPEDELTQLTFGTALLSMRTGGIRTSKPKRPGLRLVRSDHR